MRVSQSSQVLHIPLLRWLIMPALLKSNKCVSRARVFPISFFMSSVNLFDVSAILMTGFEPNFLPCVA